MSVVESLTLAIPFALSHNFEDAERDPIAESRVNGKAVDWYKSQVRAIAFLSPSPAPSPAPSPFPTPRCQSQERTIARRIAGARPFKKKHNR